MYRFRKKSETKRPQVIEDGVDLLIPPPSSTSSTFDRSPTLPALSTGLEFRTSVIFPDLTRQFAKAGLAANVPESKLRSRLAQQRAKGNKEETITEEEEAIMFAALSSIQGIRRRGNSTSSVVDASVDMQYPESVSSSKSSGPSSAGLINSFPETPAVQETSIYPFASLSSHSSSSSSSRRHSNNLFGASRLRDISQMRSHRNRSSSSASTSQESMQAVAISPDSSQAGDIRDGQEVTSSSSSSPVVENGNHQLSDKDKTPTARVSNLPSAPRLPNGNTLTVAQIRRMSVALERAMSALIESDPEADEDEEKILAPYSVPLGGGYPPRRPPTAFNDPNHPIAVADLNAVLAFLADSERARDSHVGNDPHSIPTPVAPVPVTRTPGYVPGMARPISPRDTSGHESEDYSTTPRATSPVSPYGRVHRGLVPQSKKQANSRPSTAPTVVATANAGPMSNWGAHDESMVATLERSLSAGGQLYERRMQGNGYGYSSMAVSQNGRTLTSGGSSTVNSNTQRPATAQNGVQAYTNDGFGRHAGIQSSYKQNQDIDLTRGMPRDKSNLHSITGPALPDSPMIHDDMFKPYVPLTVPESWDATQTYATPQPSMTSSGIIMPQPTTHRPMRTPVSIPVRSQTPNNIARSSTPTGARATSPPIGRVGTPNYLVQRSPSANGYNLDQETQDITVKRAVSPRPASSHTPSNSSTSAYNPLLHSSMGSSSRSSIGSIGSSYHSSDEEPNSKFKEVTNWLFDPESKGSTFANTKKNGRSREELAGSKEYSDVKDDASESIDDQEDVLQLLTGLTKKDIGTIQQKLISAAAAREAEEAIRTTQRRRRPSVQSREFVGSPTPKPVASSPSDTTPVGSNHIDAITIVRLQSPPPGPNVIPEEQYPQLVETVVQPPMIVARPMSPVEETHSEVKIPGEFEVPSAATTPPRFETPSPAKQSPRTKALTDALFGDHLTPAAPGPKHQPSVEELQVEVEKRALAATVALKSPVVVPESSPLRKKSTKRIDLQKISNPHLVSASMSVDAIPLASPSMASLSMTQTQDLGRSGSKLGDRLRRLRGSIKTKGQQGPGHEREPSSSSLSNEITPNGPSQVLDYDPQSLSTPQIRTVPPTTPNKPLSAGLASPPASAGPAGLRGLVARFRQSKGNPRKEESTPPRSAVSVQPSASSSSSHLNDADGSMTMGNIVVPPSRNTSLNRAQPAIASSQSDVTSLNRAQPAIASSQSDVTSISSGTAQTPDEAALRKRLLETALTLGLNAEDINVLLERAAKTATHSDSPSDTSQRTMDEGQLAIGQASTSLSRQTSTRVRIDASARLRPTREGGNPISGVVRRTIIYPSSTATPSTSPLPGYRGVLRKMSSASNKRRPMSVQSQYSGKSIHERVPTPPPPRGARRISEDGLPPIPSSLYSSSARPGTSAGIIYDGISNSHRRSIDGHDGGPDSGFPEDGRALQVVELENGEVVWSVLDTLRSPGDEFDDESRSIYFNRRGSFNSQYSGMDESVRSTYGRSTSRTGMPKPSLDGTGPETKIYYGDNKEIARLIGQITNATDYGSQMGHVTPGSAYSSEDLPVEEQLERLLQRVTAAQ
ncbi:hypothetical protein FRB91_006899 [Serendipita sp. 411]|nr:hypothetical protein FRB91_006899 [Serendipita sp. 411]